MRNILPNWSIPMRNWQIEFAENFLITLGKILSFLCVACPGAGKTLGALRLIHKLFKDDMIDFVIVVVPTENLKTQWCRNAYGRNGNIGLELLPKFSSDSNMFLNYHGFCVTYAQLENISQQLNKVCIGYRVLLVSDECHHAGEGLNWGTYLEESFINSEFKLMLSGTPFRSDDCKIPFIDYTDEISRADYEYTYSQAIRDGVCRSVEFFQFDGYFEWETTKLKDDLEKSNKYGHKISDIMDDQTYSECLQMALDPYSEYFKEMLLAADGKLNELRNTISPNAGGLIAAMDQFHAQRIKSTILSLINEDAEIIISDDPDSKEKLNNFEKSNDKWVIAVRMISEGTDIPRLMVGIYATIYRRELFFQQLIGRFVRMQLDLPSKQKAYIFIPADLRSQKLCAEIEEQKVHSLLDIPESQRFNPKGLLEEPEEEVEKSKTMKTLFLNHSEITDVEIVEEATRSDLGKKGVQTPIPTDLIEQEGDMVDYKTKKELITQAKQKVNLISMSNMFVPDKVWTEWRKFGGHELNKMNLKGIRYFNKWLEDNYKII